MNTKLLIAAGGTGGHIYPGLTIAREWRTRFPHAEVVFVGSKRGLEKDIIPSAGYTLHYIHAAPLSRKPSLRTIRGLAISTFGLTQAIGLMRTFRPGAVVGTGGYAAGPVLAAAVLCGIPTLVQEQNAFPGIANRLLAPFVKIMALGYKEAGQHLSSRANLVVTGNPIRREITQRSRQDALANLGIHRKKRVLVVFGASQGAKKINKAMVDNFDNLSQYRDLQVIHQTGKGDYEHVIQALESKAQGSAQGDGHIFGNYRVLPYIHNMPDVLAVAHLVVARAGALSIAELTARGLPIILIPYPYAAENHQEKNARVLEKAGAAHVILDRNLTAPALMAAVTSLLTDEIKLKKMALQSQKLGQPQAGELILNLLSGLIAQN